MSCNNHGQFYSKIDEIRCAGDTNPTLALAMLDSLGVTIPQNSERLSSKFNLAKLRIQDKANITPQSDLAAKKLLDDYEQKGTDAELQEVYYYAGSVYRDLRDTPRALEYFLKSSELAESDPSPDSLMLRNTYSNLCYLFFGVQDYRNAHRYSKMEYDISRKLNKTELTCLMHLGMTYTVLDSMEKAKDIYVYTLDTISSTPQLSDNVEILVSLLSNFSYLQDTANAAKCFRLLEKKHVSNSHDNKCYAYGEYYKMIGKSDSAIHYYKCILRNKSDLYRMYDASKALYHIFHKRKQTDKSDEYAALYIQISDSIDLGKRQELAATVNNEFQYHRDMNREQEIIRDKEHSRKALLSLIIGAIVVAVSAVIFILFRKYQYLKNMHELQEKLNEQSKDKKKLQADIVAKEKELAASRSQLDQSNKELDAIREELDKINEQLSQSAEELEEKELILAERMEQNQNFMNMLHQTELEKNAQDVVYDIRQAVEGKKDMTDSDWKQLYKAIDELYPKFKDLLLEKLGSFTEQQMQVCYLMRIGLTNSQIQNITNLSRATIWRWMTKYKWIQTDNAEGT